MSMDPQDFISRRVLSDCCGAPVMLGDMCSDCREHCTAEHGADEQENETPPDLPKTPAPTLGQIVANLRADGNHYTADAIERVMEGRA